jgi:hypothetical protein
VRFRQHRYYSGAAILLLALTVSATAADLQYTAELDPVAFDNSTVKNNVGIGHVTATLSGSSLTVSGNYSGLSSAATDAHVKVGLAAGVPGTVVGDLKISGGTDGQISGTVKLTSAQAKVLAQGGVSVVVDNDKAGPLGTLWGWLSVPQ